MSSKAPGKIRGILTGLALFVISLCASLLIAELAFDYFWPAWNGQADTEMTGGTFARYAEDYNLLTELVPGAVVTIRGVTFSINSWGARDDQFELTKPAGKERVALIGDSLGFPFGLNHTDGFEYLTEKLSGGSIEMLNFSVPGYNSLQEEITLREKAMRFNPDTVLVVLCSNDQIAAEAGSMLIWINHPKSGFAWLPGEFLKTAVTYYYDQWVFPGRVTSDRTLHLFDYLTELHRGGTRIGILSIPRRGEYSPPFFAEMQAAAARRGLDFLDLSPRIAALDTREQEEFYYSRKESLHLSRAGHEYVATALRNWLATQR